MPLDRKDLDARLAACTPAHTIKGSMFRTVCAELARLPASPERDALVARHQKAAWQELASFPAAGYLELVFAAAAMLEPQAGTASGAMELLGGKVADAFLKSVVGRVAVLMASGKTPLDILTYAPALYAPTASYGKRTFARLGPDEAVFRVREDLLPAAYHLCVRVGVALNGHRASVRVEPLGLLDCDVVVRWSPALEVAAG